MVTLLFTGRPLDIREVTEYSKAVAVVWLPGTEGGHGIMDVLTGAYNPSGKLPMSFPYSVAQAPVFYDCYSSGSPIPEGTRGDYSTRYLDMPRKPLYPFGYGLSYTDFEISPVCLSASKMDRNGMLEVSVSVKNIGKIAGTEVIQLYLRDKVASRVRPERQMKDFEKVMLEPGEKRTVTFIISEEKLRFYTAEGKNASEPGLFRVWIGASSRMENWAEFELR